MPDYHDEVTRHRKPDWLKIKLHRSEEFGEVARIVREHGLHTICSSGRCPNQAECWSRRTATFMILGDICTRSCKFCATATGKPLPPDPDEPRKLARSISLMGLKHCVVTSVDRDDLPDYNVKITACMCFSRTFMMQEYYHNSSWLENGGSPEKAARSALTSAIDAYIKQQGKYNKNESGIKWQDVQDCLVLVTNCFSTQTSYENQTKKAINNRFIQQAMTAFFKERLSTYLIENKDAANKIMEQVLINKRSRENAEKTRQSIKTNLQQKTDMANRVQKFIDCRSKDKSRREIYIVEGDSAAGAIRTSRDAEFQGVMPVRGKILNCLKEDYPRIFKSDIIMDLMRVLGCGVEIKDKRIKNLGAFDLDNLNWNKVIICTDADVDGYHIRTLVLTMLYRLVPTLIDEGYVYIAESPLYEINCKEKTYFAYTELEKNGILKEIGDQKCSINRSKGLGENDPDMMWLTTMNPETRRLIKVEPEDVTKMETMFNLLLGNDEAGRKRHISEHGKEYLDQLDLQ